MCMCVCVYVCVCVSVGKLEEERLKAAISFEEGKKKKTPLLHVLRQ